MHIWIKYRNGLHEGFYYRQRMLENNGGALVAHWNDDGSILYIMDDGTLTISTTDWDEITRQFNLWCDQVGMVMPF